MEIRICFRHSVLYTVLYKQIIFNHKKSWNFLICGLLAEYIWLVRRKRLSPGSFVSIFLPNRVLPKPVTTRLFSENILHYNFCETMSFASAFAAKSLPLPPWRRQCFYFIWGIFCKAVMKSQKRQKR